MKSNIFCKFAHAKVCTVNCFGPDDIKKFLLLVDNAHRITVLGHTHPDGDALGCTSGLLSWLTALKGKDAVAVFPDTPADTVRFIIPETLRFICHDTDPGRALGRIAESDLIILEDCNSFSRTEALETPLRASGARKILIDHHLNPDRDAFDLVFSTPEVSSASELVFQILMETPETGHDPARLPREGAEALLAGMTTDTNNFANSVFPSTFRMASDLLAAGIDRDAILARIYNNYRENRIRMMGYMQSENLRITPEGAALMVATRDILQRFDIREGETEGLVNVPLAIRGVRLSIFLKEDDGHFRVSVRSRTGTSAREYAIRYCNGGGHENAAGGKLHLGKEVQPGEDPFTYLERTTREFLS